MNKFNSFLKSLLQLEDKSTLIRAKSLIVKDVYKFLLIHNASNEHYLNLDRYKNGHPVHHLAGSKYYKIRFNMRTF